MSAERFPEIASPSITTAFPAQTTDELEALRPQYFVSPEDLVAETDRLVHPATVDGPPPLFGASPTRTLPVRLTTVVDQIQHARLATVELMRDPNPDDRIDDAIDSSSLSLLDYVVVSI